jgi:hypothetical protein
MTLSVLIPYYLFANRISEKMIDQNLPSVSYAYFYQLNYRNIGSLYEKEYIDSSVTSYDSPAAVSYDSIDSSVANSALSYSRLEAQSRKNIVIALGSNVLKEFDDFKLVSDTQNPYVQYRYSPYINNAPIYPKIYYNDVSDDSTYSEKFNRWIYKRRIRCHINGALNDSFVTRSFFFLSGRKAGSDSIVVSDINLLNYLLVKYKMIEDAAFRRYPDRRNSEMTRNDIGLFEETQRFSFMDDIYDNYRRFLHAQDIKNDVLGILDLGVSISIYLSALWFIIYSIRKLFGIKMFLLGLVLPVILSAILVICISTDFMELNPHEYLLLLLILYFFMLALSFFVKKNKKYHKILLQLSIYSTFILLGLFSVLLPKVFQFPDFISNIPIQWYFYCIASCSVLFSIYFFERTYKLFLKPESK